MVECFILFNFSDLLFTQKFITSTDLIITNSHQLTSLPFLLISCNLISFNLFCKEDILRQEVSRSLVNGVPLPATAFVPKMHQDALSNPSGQNQEQSTEAQKSNDISTVTILSTPEKNQL